MRHVVRGLVALAAATTMLLGSGCEPTAPDRLAAVEHWYSHLALPLPWEVVEAIAASDHDLVVIDPAVTDIGTADYPIADVVAYLQAHGKVVVAYLDVGEAESYRTYWGEDWGIGDPEWIVAEDPDGWDENYPVAYWHPEWQALWLDEGGLVDVVATSGFDGIYLDWVEAYDDERVATAAADDGVDPAEEMVGWVRALAERLRATDGDALVIQQNAAELAATQADLRGVIDAVAQEQVWFDGGADGDPPGDCPLPATDADVGSEEYLASLSPPCLRQWEEYPESTLHVSSESYLRDLDAIRASGLPVLTVDYATEPANVDAALRNARARGFVPFVGVRELDQWVPPR